MRRAARSFRLPHKQQLLGLPAGQHVMVRVPKRGGGAWERPYNPTSTDAQPGVVEFLVKVRPRRQPGCTGRGGTRCLTKSRPLQVRHRA